MVKIQNEFIGEGHAINTILYMIGTKDVDLMNHSYRVAKLAILIAHELQLPQNVVQRIRLAALMHDVGKFCIDSKLLYKTGLAKVDTDIIQMHATYGYMLMKRLNVSWPLADIVHQHHERQDGSGYPQGLTGDSIMLEARIIAVADFVESITYAQPYGKMFALDNGINDLNNNFANKFDKDVMDACIRIFMKRDFVLNDFWESC